ncbi:MAG: hypothetical protein AB7S80_04400 [Rhizobiaceae bacterium]
MYADQLIPQIALGVALDWVLIAIAFLMGRIRDATPPEEDDVSDISLAQARRNHRELMRLMHDLTDQPGAPLGPPLEPEPYVQDPELPWEEEDEGRAGERRNVVMFPEPAE